MQLVLLLPGSASLIAVQLLPQARSFISFASSSDCHLLPGCGVAHSSLDFRRKLRDMVRGRMLMQLVVGKLI
ncbi:hypothetical protein HD806DRAFT_411888 [Xylariaceae sp. AK1471]|nr:hypothetical protein HD806DRAFT_411888 [Xylariaceae sp. AK1471]